MSNIIMLFGGPDIDIGSITCRTGTCIVIPTCNHIISKIGLNQLINVRDDVENVCNHIKYISSYNWSIVHVSAALTTLSHPFWTYSLDMHRMLPRQPVKSSLHPLTALLHYLHDIIQILIIHPMSVVLQLISWGIMVELYASLTDKSCQLVYMKNRHWE